MDFNLPNIGDFSSVGATLSSSSNAPAPPPAEYIDNIIRLSAMREDGKSELIDILQSLRGRKCLVLEPQLGGLLNLIIQEGSRILKENGVQYFRELRGELGEFITDSGGRDTPENIVYLVRPNLSLMKVIANQIQTYLKSGNVYFYKKINLAFVMASKSQCVFVRTRYSQSISYIFCTSSCSCMRTNARRRRRPGTC